MKKFSIWLENRTNDEVSAAVLGAVSSGDILSHENKDFLMRQRTSEFGADIKNKLKNLGVITVIENDDPQRYQDIIHSIDTGILLSDLITKINGNEANPIVSQQKGQYF